MIFNAAVCEAGPTTNSRVLWSVAAAAAAAAAWVWLQPVPQWAQSLCVPAATEAAAVLAKTTRAVMTWRCSLAIASKGGREGVDWGAAGVLALGSCSGAQ